VLYDQRREAVAAIGEQGHAEMLSHPRLGLDLVAVTMPSGDHRPELQHPTPHRFIGEVEPTLGEQLLDVSVAQGEAEIEPDRVLYDLGREAMTAIAEQSHAATPNLRAAPARLRCCDNAE
jgi:hypothetical protein